MIRRAQAGSARARLASCSIAGPGTASRTFLPGAPAGISLAVGGVLPLFRPRRLHRRASPAARGAGRHRLAASDAATLGLAPGIAFALAGAALRPATLADGYALDGPFAPAHRAQPRRAPGAMALSASDPAVAPTGDDAAPAIQLPRLLARSVSRALGGARLGAAGLAAPAVGWGGAGSTSRAEPERGPLGSSLPVALALDRPALLNVGIGHGRRSFLQGIEGEREARAGATARDAPAGLRSPMPAAGKQAAGQVPEMFHETFWGICYLAPYVAALIHPSVFLEISWAMDNIC